MQRPGGLWVFSLVCDLAHAFGASSPNWEVAARYTMIGGIVGALLAAVPGLVDLLSLPAHVKRIGIAHMALNLAIVVLYLINAWLRRDGVTDGAIWLSVLSIILLGVSGWLGGHMVYVHRVAVEPDRRNGASQAAYRGPERRMAIQ